MLNSGARLVGVPAPVAVRHGGRIALRGHRFAGTGTHGRRAGAPRSLRTHACTDMSTAFYFLCRLCET